MVDRNEMIVAAGVATGGVALGFAAGVLAHRLGRGGGPVDCSKVTSTGGEVAGVRYLERMRGKADPNAAVPMVVLFHSMGARPEGHARMLANIGPSRLIVPQGAHQTATGGYKWWRKGVKAGVTGDAEERAQAVGDWQAASDRAAEFIRQIVRCRPTLGKPILTGSSQGGEMTLLLASTRPDIVHSGVAVSSYLLEPFWNKRMAPVRMIHGTGDRTVRFDWAQDYAERMIDDGAALSFQAYQSDGHSVTKEMGGDWASSLKGEVARASALA
jgi:phospholipase/carboxylesterase